MTTRNANRLLALVAVAALAVNAASHTSGWALVGEIFGWVLIIGGTYLVVDNKIKEMQE